MRLYEVLEIIFCLLVAAMAAYAILGGLSGGPR